MDELESFLGLCGYYRRFVKSYSELSLLLERVKNRHSRSANASKQNIIEFNDDELSAFNSLKEALISAPVLGFPTKDDTFILDTDASDHSTGAVLSQLQHGKEVVIAYASHRLSKSERLYCVTRKELFSVYRYIKQFKHYLLGKKFHVRTDHRALLWLLNWSKPNTSQYCSWKGELEGYDFSVEHRPGTLHKNADALSRRPCGQCELEHNMPCPKRNVKCYNEELNNIHQKHMKDANTVMLCHRNLGHCGSWKCFQYLKRLYGNVFSFNLVKETVNKCKICLINKPNKVDNRNKMNLTVDGVFKKIAIDISGPFNAYGGFRYILAIIDHFSKYVCLIPLKSTDAKTVCEKLIQEWISKLGIPQSIHTDRGSNFESDIFKEVCSFFKIRKTRTTPYYPQGDGVVERMFGTIKPMIRCLIDETGNKWPSLLPWLTLAINNTKSKSTNLEPNTVIFGRLLNDPFMNETKYSNSTNIDAKQYADFVRRNVNKSYEYVRSQAPKENQKIANKFKVGDYVVKRIPQTRSGMQMYDGPYKVIKILGPNAIRMQHRDTNKLADRNVKFVKRYLSPLTVSPKTNNRGATNEDYVSKRYANRPQRIATRCVTYL